MPQPTRLSNLFVRIAEITNDVPVLGDFVTRWGIIERYARKGQPRPRPWSMSHPYPTWVGQVDRRFTGRHLPQASDAFTAALPPEADVVDLFRRDSFIPAPATSVLFMFFAQWFTDSFLRTNPADGRLNDSNHEIDLCQIYGLKEEQTKMLRHGSDGLLAHQIRADGEWPVFLYDMSSGAPVLKTEFEHLHSPENLARVTANVSDAAKAKMFAVGLEHGNATIGYTLFNTLFLREHNRTARLLAKTYPSWDDERLFQTARNIMIVMGLKIVMEHYISFIAPADLTIRTPIGAADRAPWGKSNRIAIEFNLLYRWHALVPDSMHLAGQDLGPTGFMNNNELAMEVGLEQMIRDFSAQKAGKIGLQNYPAPMFIGRGDKPSTVARTIALMRSAKLRSYNDYRRHFGLKPIFSFEDLTEDPALADRLRALYGQMSNLEWFIGIWAESYGPKHRMGDLLTAMVAHDAFTQVLTNPLLSRNLYTSETFSPAGLDLIDATSTVADFVDRNLGPDIPCSFSA